MNNQSHTLLDTEEITHYRLTVRVFQQKWTSGVRPGFMSLGRVSKENLLTFR